MVTSMAEFSPPTDADLVAYLDGEVDEAARQAIASQLRDDAALRAPARSPRSSIRRQLGQAFDAPSRRRAEGPARGDAGARRGGRDGGAAGEPPVATGRRCGSPQRS